jgi:hypothetical protein
MAPRAVGDRNVERVAVRKAEAKPPAAQSLSTGHARA